MVILYPSSHRNRIVATNPSVWLSFLTSNRKIVGPIMLVNVTSEVSGSLEERTEARFDVSTSMELTPSAQIDTEHVRLESVWSSAIHHI